MNEQIQIQLILKESLLENQKKNASYSLRALAKKLEMNPAALSEIMRGNRRVSKKMAEKILSKLMVSPKVAQNILSNFPDKLSNDSKYKTQNQTALITRQLSHEKFEVVSDWVHFAILSLIKTTNFVSDIHWMAERLAVAPKQIEEALTNLESQFLIEKDEHGNYRRTSYAFSTPRDVLNLSVQKAHLNDLEIVKNKMKIDVKFRDFTSFTLPVDPSLLSDAKDIIRKAQDDINKLMERGDRTAVYRHCSYLFPLTNDYEHKENV